MVAEEYVLWPCDIALTERRAMEDPLPPAGLAELTAQMTRGEEAAYRTFYEHYFHRLLRYLLVLTAGKEDAAREALQLTLVRVVRHVRRFESEEVFWSWLTVLARSSLVDEERKRKRYFGLLDRFLAWTRPEDFKSFADADGALLAALDQELAALPADERTLLERKYFDGFAVKDIAGELDMTEKTIESRLVRIRRKLKTTLLTQLRNEV
jgi:RNA polymerase sigma-70 factor (ECF subfamily)